jgi:hypothetical protein
MGTSSASLHHVRTADENVDNGVRVAAEDVGVDVRVAPPPGTAYPPPYKSAASEIRFLDDSRSPAVGTTAITSSNSSSSSLISPTYFDGSESVVHLNENEKKMFCDLSELPAGCVMTCSDKIAKWNALGLQVHVNTIIAFRLSSQPL